MKGAGLKTDLISTEFIPSRLQSGIVTDGLILYLNVWNISAAPTIRSHYSTSYTQAEKDRALSFHRFSRVGHWSEY